MQIAADNCKCKQNVMFCNFCLEPKNPTELVSGEASSICSKCTEECLGWHRKCGDKYSIYACDVCGKKNCDLEPGFRVWKHINSGNGKFPIYHCTECSKDLIENNNKHNRKMRLRKNNNELYVTPQHAVWDLLERVPFLGNVWEPCCGTGAISDILELFVPPKSEELHQRFPNVNFDKVYTSDVNPQRDKDLKFDFRYLNKDIRIDNIITNCPWSRNKDVFIMNAVSIARQKVAFLLPDSYLSADCRANFLKLNPIHTIYLFKKKLKYSNKCGNAIEMKSMWCIWENGFRGKMTLETI